VDIYSLVKRDLDGLKENDKIRHGKPLEIDARRDILYSIYQKALAIAVELRTELARKEGQ
jgi:hypothetical protein